MTGEWSLAFRPARDADCPALGRIQIDSYRSAYAPSFPPGYFDDMTYEEQEADWREWLRAHPDDVLLVAEAEGEVWGYVLARARHDIYPGYDAEVLALHVRVAYRSRGAGSALLHAAMEALRSRGCRSVMLWTLRDHAARQWYERLDGRLIGEKTDDVDGWPVTEVAYGWPDISELLSH